MWVLVLTEPSGNSRQIPFEGDQLVLGRSRSADITVEDPRMSRMHLRFARGAGGSLTVEDLGAANGVSVGGERIGSAPVAVAVGARIEFGDCRVVVAAPVAAYAPGLSQASLPAVGAELESRGAQPWRLVLANGREYPIAGPTVVGRSLGADITLDHASVSRRHVMLVPLPKHKLRIEDAGGTNGIFVDGQRLTGDMVLTAKSAVIFGEVEAILEPDRGKRSRIPLPRFDRGMLQKVLVVVLAVAGVALLLTPPPPPRRTAWEQRRAEVDRSLTRAKEFESKQAWDEALPAVEQALALDPLNDEAGRLRNRIKQEVAAGKKFDDAIGAFDTGDYDAALTAFGAIPAGTRHYAEAQEKKVKAQDRLLEGYKDKAERACRLSRWSACQSESCTYLAYGHSEAMIRLLAKAEARLRGKRGFEACVAHQAQEITDPEARKRIEVLETLYPDPRLRRAMNSYAEGKLEDAVRQLGKLLDSGRRSLQGQASSLRHEVQRVEGYLKRLRELERTGNLEMALRQWGNIQKTDRELLKEKVNSAVIKDARQLISGFLLTRAGDRRTKKRYPGALADLKIVALVAPSSVKLKVALDKLAAEAPKAIADEAKTMSAAVK